MCLNLLFEVKNQMTFYKLGWFKELFDIQYIRCFKNFWGPANILLQIPLKMGKNEEDFESSIFFEGQKCYFVFESRLNFFSNGHIRNVVSKLPSVVKIDVENDSVVSTLSNVVQLNVEIHHVVSTLLDVVNFNNDVHNIVSTLSWRCATSLRHINLKTTLNRPWNVCWLGSKI